MKRFMNNRLNEFKKYKYNRKEVKMFKKFANNKNNPIIWLGHATRQGRVMYS